MEETNQPKLKVFTMQDVEMLFEDNHFLIVNKPSGILVQPDKSGNQNVEGLVKEWIKKKYHKPGNVFVGVPHRLDKPVSGVLVLCKTSKALVRFNEMLRNRQVKKTYWAVVENKPEKLEDTLIHWLRKSPTGNYSKAFTHPMPNSLECKLSYKYLSSSQYYHLLEVHPITGRHHQIRVQLASIGCHIKGDHKYGARRDNRDGSIHLHARKIEFIHPVKDETIEVIAAPNPEDKVWAAVQAALKL
jgi:23S rRNA pseudouridine1911/1915/1917 synthase